MDGGRRAATERLGHENLVTDCKKGHTSRSSSLLNVALQFFVSREGLSFPHPVACSRGDIEPVLNLGLYSLS